MKKSISLLTVVCLTGFGGFFTNLRQAFSSKEEAQTTEPPAATTVPYERPVGMNEAPEGNGKLVALTFDDGPGGEITMHILDTLEEHGGRATFFCLGDRAQEYQATLRRMVKLGCEVASHSYSHERLTRLGSDELKEDLARTQEAILTYSGVEPKLLRAPYGSVSEYMLSNSGMPQILWSIDSEDWRYCEQLCKDRSDEQRECDFINVVNSVVDYIQDGDIILMHDLYAFTQDLADAVIAELDHRGWQMVTVSELFAAKGIPLEPGKVYHCAR